MNYRTGIANTNTEILEKFGAIVQQFGGIVTPDQPIFEAYYLGPVNTN